MIILIISRLFMMLQIFHGNLNSSVSIVPAWTTARSRFDTRQMQTDFSSRRCIHIGSGAHPASCSMGTGGSFPGRKERPGHDADPSPRLVPRSGMSRSYIFSAPCTSMVCCGTALLLKIFPTAVVYSHTNQHQRGWEFAVLKLPFPKSDLRSPYDHLLPPPLHHFL
jgi:hypothetical protein